MYDIDNFKQMNETGAHLRGRRARPRRPRAGGVLPRGRRHPRYGGDEIIILAHMNSLAEALAAAERSVAHVSDTVGVTVSVGSALSFARADHRCGRPAGGQRAAAPSAPARRAMIAEAAA
jgi:GGDEF domain-containing protein